MKQHVVVVLRPRRPVDLGSRAVPQGAAKIHSNHLIDDLRLTIRLRVERRAQAKLHASHLEKVMPHVAREDRIAITNNGGGGAM